MTKWLRYDLFLLIIFLVLATVAEYREAFSIVEDQTLFFRHSIRSHFGDAKEMGFPYDKIVLITVDDHFYREYGKAPLRRADLAKIISNLNYLGAGIICVDMLMDLPSAYGEDPVLAKALKLSNSAPLLASQSVFDADNQFLRIDYPTPLLKESAVTGYVNIASPSSLDTFLSRLTIYPDITRLEDGWPIAVQLVSQYLGVSPSLDERTLRIGDISVKLDHFNDMYIDFSTIPRGYRFIHQLAGISAFEYLDLSDLRGDELRELREWVAGKIVIIGETAISSNEWFDTPVGLIFGVEIIADTVNTLLKGAPLRPAPFFLEFLASLMMMGATVWIASGVTALRRQLPLALGLFFSFFLITTLLYAFRGVVFSMTYPLALGVTLYIILVFFSYYKERHLVFEARKEKMKAELECRAAEAASRAKGDFLANISHEIRNPMNAILGFADILDKQIDDIQQKQYLSAILNSGRTLLALLKDTMDLSKIEAGKLELEYNPFSPRLMLNDLSLIFSGELDKKDIPFIMDIAPDLPEMLMLDETRLRQVLHNLISNAVKFTNIGYVKLEVYFSAGETGESGHLIFSVEDTGIGIAPDQEKRIFEAFEQQKGQQYARFGGTGLGLAISRRLVGMMGGEITVSSTPGAGSVFQVILKNVHICTPDNKDEAEIAPSPESIVFEAASILLAEDNLFNRELIRNFLGSFSFQLLEAENGKEGVELAQSHSPDLILMDIKMPVMDGCKAAQLIKSNTLIKDIPIIAVTASFVEFEKDVEQRMLFDNYLIKPVSKQELIKELMQYLPYKIETRSQDDPRLSPGEPPSSPEFTATPESESVLCGLLEQEMKNGWGDFSDVMFIDRIEAFGEQMALLGREYGYPPLVQWGKELQVQSGRIDVPVVQRILREFPQLIDELKNHKNKSPEA